MPIRLKTWMGLPAPRAFEARLLVRLPRQLRPSSSSRADGLVRTQFGGLFEEISLRKGRCGLIRG